MTTVEEHAPADWWPELAPVRKPSAASNLSMDHPEPSVACLFGIGD